MTFTGFEGEGGKGYPKWKLTLSQFFQIGELVEFSTLQNFISLSHSYTSYPFFLSGVTFSIIYNWIRLVFRQGDFNELIREKTMNKKLTDFTESLLKEILSEAANTFDGEAWRFFRMLICVYYLMLLWVILRGLHHSPRLSFVTRTVTYAGSNLWYFAVVFGFVIVGFSAAGQVAFGETAKAFSSFRLSFLNLYIYSYGEFPDITIFDGFGQNFISGIFFIGFSLSVTLILLNIVLAILLESYVAIKAQSKDASYKVSLRIYYVQYATMFVKQLTRSYLSYAAIHSALVEYRASVESELVRQRTEKMHTSNDGTRFQRTLTPMSPDKESRWSKIISKSTLTESLVTAADLVRIIPSLPLTQAQEVVDELCRDVQRKHKEKEHRERNLLRRASHEEDNGETVGRKLTDMQERFDRMERTLQRHLLLQQRDATLSPNSDYYTAPAPAPHLLAGLADNDSVASGA